MLSHWLYFIKCNIITTLSDLKEMMNHDYVKCGYNVLWLSQYSCSYHLLWKIAIETIMRNASVHREFTQWISKPTRQWAPKSKLKLYVFLEYAINLIKLWLVKVVFLLNKRQNWYDLFVLVIEGMIVQCSFFFSKFLLHLEAKVRLGNRLRLCQTRICSKLYTVVERYKV